MGGARHGPRRARSPAAARASCPTTSTPAPGRGARRGPRLRRVPHRPAHPRRRGARLAAAGGPGPPDRRHRARGGPRPRTSRGRASASRGWAGPTGRAASAAAGARTSASARAVHRPGPRRRLRDARGGRRALCLRAARGLRRPRGRAAAVRRAHRPPRAADDRRRAAARALRLRRQRPHRLPGRASTRAGACSPSPAPATTRVAGLRAGARLRVGGRRAGPGARGARRGDHLRPRRRARAGGAARRWAAAAWSCARAST